MKYLAVSHNADYAAWSFFDGRMLHSVDKIIFNEFEPHKQIYEFYNHILYMLETHNIGVIVVKELNINQIKKKHLETYFNYRGVLKMLAAQMGIIYHEAKTDGWELYITGGKNTDKKKLKIVNEGYQLPFTSDEYNFKHDDVEMANAIILGEAVAHGRIHV
jgi:hypothetical protein